MGILDRRRRLRMFAAQMRKRKPPTESDYAWLATVMAQIGNGMDANVALGVKRTKGHSIADELARQRLNFTLFYVASAIDLGVERASAFEEGVRVLRRLHGVDPCTPDEKYSIESLKRAWNKFPDWCRPYRLPGEDDSVL